MSNNVPMGDNDQDPSMEEILASIKRVIADEGRSAVAPRAARPAFSGPVPIGAPPADPADQDVLELNAPVAEGETLLSDERAEATRQSLAALASVRRQAESHSVPVGDGALEAVVRDMLRPMLKEWLDERLPQMIEEMVAREIARLTGNS